MKVSTLRSLKHNVMWTITNYPKCRSRLIECTSTGGAVSIQSTRPVVHYLEQAEGEIALSTYISAIITGYDGVWTCRVN